MILLVKAGDPVDWTIAQVKPYLEKGDIIITAYGKPAAFLHHVTDEDVADYLIENDPEFRTKVAEAYADYLRLGGIEAGELVKKLEKRHARKAA